MSRDERSAALRQAIAEAREPSPIMLRSRVEVHPDTLEALLDERDHYRTALETIKRTTKSGGAEAIAREALNRAVPNAYDGLNKAQRRLLTTNQDIDEEDFLAEIKRERGL